MNRTSCAVVEKEYKMAESWDEYADGWDTNEDVRAYSAKAFNSLIERIELDGLEVLDFGCGTGLLTEKMSPLVNHILALDNSEKMLEILQRKNLSNVELLVCNLTQEKINSEKSLQRKFDLIVASSVCAFLEDYHQTLRLLMTLLKINGVFVQWDWMKSESDPNFGFSKEDIESALKYAGFKVVSISEVFSLESEHGVMSVLMGIGEKV